MRLRRSRSPDKFANGVSKFMWYILYLYVVVFSLVISLLLTRLMRRVARSSGILDMPADRKIHGSPIPLLGGAAILGAAVLTLLFNAFVLFAASRCESAASLLPSSLAVHLAGALSVLPKLGIITLGGVLIFLLGLWDDISDISPYVKLLGQILVALILVLLNVRVTLFISNYAFSLVITIVWIVAIVNAFNLLDNMDGLCAGVAVIASLVFLGISAFHGHYFIALLLAAFIGSLVGFLRYNFPPASIFMGDAGSMFVGYLIAVLAIMQTYYHPGAVKPLAVLMPVVILAVPIYDTLSVIVIRISRGESIFRADRRHFSHRLLNLGMSRRGAVLFIYLVTICTGLSATLLPRVSWAGGTVILAQTILIVSIIAILEYFGGDRRRDA